MISVISFLFNKKKYFLYVFFIVLGWKNSYSQKRTYEYDNLNQLIKVNVYSGSTLQHSVEYTYDQVGNRLTKTVQVPCNIAAPAVSGVSIPYNTTFTLTASNCGNMVKWYSAASGGSVLHTGSTFTTPALVVNTTYYASCMVQSCESSRTPVTVTVQPACNQPDLIISDILVTKYTSDRIYYRVVVKNIGEQAASLGSFGFATYGDPSGILNGSAVQKHVMFMGGGTLAKNQTINYDTYMSMNYSSNQHYIIVEADHHKLITECNEANNVLSKVIKPCKSPGDLTLTGSQPSGFIASNGVITIASGATFSANTVVAGKAINGIPNLTASANNVNFLTGTCINVVSGFPDDYNPIFEGNRPAPVPPVSFSENSFAYTLSSARTLSVSIWDAATRSKVRDVEVNSVKSSGTYHLPSENLIKGKQYFVQIETEGMYFNKLIEC